MATTFGVRATTAVSCVDADFFARAAKHAGGHGSIVNGIIVGDGFPTRRNVEQFCTRVNLRFPNLNFEISRPASRKVGVDLVFHDADRKFSQAFRECLRNRGARPRKLRPRSPNLNAYVERWIQTIQVECLDHFIVLGEGHLNHLVAEFVAHYHDERPHQGLDNQLIMPGKPPPNDASVPSLRQLVCRERLGGLLKHYERRAA